MSNIILPNSAPLSTYSFANQIFELMSKDFKFSVKDRLVIVPEVAIYRIKEDESIFNQAKAEKYDYQVYFDGEFVCFVKDTETKEYVRLNILKGLAKLYKEGKIHWNKFLYDVDKQKFKDEQKRKEQDLEAKLSKAKTPEEKIIVEAVKKSLKKDEKPKKL